MTIDAKISELAVLLGDAFQSYEQEAQQLASESQASAVIAGEHATSAQSAKAAAEAAKSEATAAQAAAESAEAGATAAQVEAEAAALVAQAMQFRTRAELASAIAGATVVQGQLVAVNGVVAVIDSAATGARSALNGLGVNGVRILGAEIKADFWLGDAAAGDDKAPLIQECFDYSLAHRQAQGGNGATKTVLTGRHWVQEPLTFGGAATMSLDAAGAVLMARTGGTLFDTAATEGAAKYMLTLTNAGQTQHTLPYMICNHGCNGVYLSGSFNAIYRCQRVLYYLWRGLLIDRVIGKNAGSVLYDLTGDEWGTGETEFNFEANYKAIGLLVNTNDIRVVNAHIGYSKYAMWNGAEGFGVEYINCHPYVGNPNINGGTAPAGAEKRQHPRVFVNQCPGVVNVYDCYFDGGYVDDQTGTVNFHGCWAVPSEWVNWSNADSVLTKPLLRVRKQDDVTTMTGSIKDCKMSFGFYTGNWPTNGAFNSPVDMVQDAALTGGRGYVNHWSQLETRLILNSGASVDNKTIKQGGTAQVIREEFFPGTGGKVTVDYGGNYMKVLRAQGGGRIDVSTDQTGIASDGSDLQLFTAGSARVVVQNNGVMRPATDNAQTLGNPSNRWSTVYAGSGSISTSDARVKQDVRELSDAERAVARRVKHLIRAFRFSDAVSGKGQDARIHFGVMAQDVAEAFTAEGLDPMAYGIVCYDAWDEIPARVDEDTGVELEPARPAGDRWGIRYDELTVFLIGALL